MKFQDIFESPPLPSDWDADIFNERVPFAVRVRYAKERAQQLGVGSSRIAFEIPYQGRSTVLKIAKNRKGAAQNEYESQMMNDYLLEQERIIVPIIDHDERSSQPTWIHVERAEKARNGDFIRATGGLGLNDLMRYINVAIGRVRGNTEEMWPDIDPENEFISGLAFLTGNYDIALGDIGRTTNWGIHRGRPVIVDIGASTEIIKQYYMGR